MKKFLALGAVMLGFISMSQIQDNSAQKPCYEKSRPEPGRRFVDWQCGKVAAVVDCNEKLSFDERSNTVTIAKNGLAFEGVCETCHNNGVLERRLTFVNGKEEGKDTTYYRSGCPQVVRTHIGGVENGQWLYYFDSTQQLAWEMNYYLGEKNGKCIYFKPNGDTTLVEFYTKGLLSGPKKTYYPNGQLEREINYLNGVFEGKFKIYSAEGKLVDNLVFKAGKKDGSQKYFYNEGSLMRTENWAAGVKDGEFKAFYIQGNVQSVEFYKRGQKEGLFLEYYPDQKLKRKAIYKKDVLIEDHQYDEDGEETYTFGVEVEVELEDDSMPFGDPNEKPKKNKEKKPKKEKEPKESKKD